MAKKKKVDEVLKEEVINEEEKDNEIEESEEETKEEEQTDVLDENVVEEEKDEEEEEKDNKNIEIISLDNQPVSPIIAEEESEEVPTNFVPARKTAKNSKKVAKHLIHNGRVYKVLNNGRGMYADTGETFSLTELR